MKISKRCWLLCILFGVLTLNIQAVNAQESFKIFLIGDAGDHTESGETLKNLHNELRLSPNSAVIFLGDNSYKDILWGLIPFGYKGFDSSRNTIEKIRSQLNILEDYKGYAYFTPGNHDWWNRTSYERGKLKLVMEENFIEENLKLNKNISNPNQVFLPTKGDYGPVFVELNNRTIRIIFIDTYRIIQTGIKKNNIVPEAEKTFYFRLDSTIKEGYDLKQKIFVVAHHPVHSVGPYNNDIKHPDLFRRIKASMATFPSYHLMASRIDTILRRYPGIYYASGHVHALQYFYGKDSVHYIVSGSGSKERMLSEKEIIRYDADEQANEYLLWNSGGFFEIEFNGETTKTTLHYDNASLKCIIQP